MEEKYFGRLMTDKQGWTNFDYRYDDIYDGWFDWRIHVIGQAPSGYRVLRKRVRRVAMLGIDRLKE